MLTQLSLSGVGPVAKLHARFANRLNVVTGDNGLGKSFLLDVAWWALTGTWPGGEVKSIESEVTYTRHDGSRVGPLPATTTLRLEDDRIKHYQIFMDPSPVLA